MDPVLPPEDNFEIPKFRPFLRIFPIIAVSIAIPLTVFLAQQQQETRQFASENPTPFILPSLTPTPIQSEPIPAQ